MSRFIVYGLVDPRDGKLFYVGRSSSGKKRALSHFEPKSIAKSSKAKRERIRDIVSAGFERPLVVVIEDCRTSKRAIMRERVLIAELSKSNNLTNAVGNRRKRDER